MGKKYSAGKPYKVIAFVLACFSNDEEQRILRKVAEEGAKQNCKIVFFSTMSDFYYNDVNDAGEKKIFDVICVDRFDAIVLMSESFKQDAEQIAMTKRALAAGVPVIAVNKYMEGCINLYYDYGDTFQDIVRHMVEDHGYRKVNFMAGFPDNLFSNQRIDAYRQVLLENGIPFEDKRVYYGHFWADPTKEAMEQMLADGLEDTEAIVCANDVMAISVCNFLMERGYRVPEDIAVSGFDGVEMEKYCRPRLTTGISDLDGMIELVFHIINGEAPNITAEKQFPLLSKMRIGQSCGCEGCETMHVASEMIQLKADLHREMKFQSDMNKMVANYANTESEIAIAAVPEYMEPLAYQDFWFCFKSGELDEDNIARQPWEKDKDRAIFSGRMQSIHYENGVHRERGNQYLIGEFPFEDLIPNLTGELEENDYLMVLPVHIKGEAIGYAVVTFDVNSFWYTAYASFVTSAGYLLDMQIAKVKMMSIYMHDHLTGLYNRTGFYERIERIMQTAQDKDMTIVSLDMDRLKYINDNFGHAEGDEALKNLSRIIQSCINHELAARIGGDEFLIAFVGNNIGKRTEEIVTHIKEGIRNYNKISGKRYELHASIGAYTNAVSTLTLDGFLKEADNLMYRRKYFHRKENGLLEVQEA